MRLLLTATMVLFMTSAHAQSAKTKISNKANKRGPAQSTSAAQSVTQASAPDSAAALSATSSNFFFQPREGASILEFRPYQSTTSMGVESTTTNPATSYSTKTKTSALEIGYKRGLSNNKAFSASTSVGSAEVSPDGANGQSYKNAGFSDFKFELSKMNVRETDEQILGGVLSVSLGTAEDGYEYSTPGSTLNADGNRYSGGHSISGYYGVQKKSATGSVFGTKVTGKIQLQTEQTSRNTNNEKVTTTSDGGHGLFGEVFTEVKKSHILLGLNGGLGIILPTQYTATAAGNDTSYEISRQTYLQLQAYGVVETNNKKVNILPSIGLTKLLSSTDGDLSLQNNDEVRLSVLARIAL